MTPLCAFGRNIVAGLLAIIPLWFTFVVMSYLVDLLIGAGKPTVNTFARRIRTDNAFLSDLLMAWWFQSTTALILVLITLYLLGILANAVVGAKDALISSTKSMEYVPLAKTVYKATRTLMNSLQHDPKGAPARRPDRIPLPRHARHRLRHRDLHRQRYRRGSRRRLCARRRRIPPPAMSRSSPSSVSSGSTGAPTTPWPSSSLEAH